MLYRRHGAYPGLGYSGECVASTLEESSHGAACADAPLKHAQTNRQGSQGTGSFIPQRRYGVDPRGAARGPEARKQPRAKQ